MSAILGRIITRIYSKQINLTIFRAHYRKHLAIDRSDDTRTETPRTKSCNELPDENSPKLELVTLDRNMTGENSQQIDLVMISVTVLWNSLLTNFRKRREVQKPNKLPWKIGMLIYIPVTWRPPISLQKEAVLLPCNFATTHSTACILKYYLP